MVFNATVNHRVSQIISQLSFFPPRRHSRCEHGVLLLFVIFLLEFLIPSKGCAREQGTMWFQACRIALGDRTTRCM